MVEWPGGLGAGAASTPSALVGNLRPSWQRTAPCAGQADLMFDDERVAEAKAICLTCDHRLACLDLALDTESSGGVWAGLTQEERLLRCPVCLGPKPRGSLACSFPHILLRTSRLIELEAEGTMDVHVPARQRPTARTSDACPLPRGCDHSSARAYRRGCRCDEAREALRLERLRRGDHASSRGPYRREAVG